MISRRIDDFVQGFELRSTGKWFVLSSLIGTVAGLGAILFQKLTHWIVTWTLVYFASYAPGEAEGEAAQPEVDPAAMSPWMIVAVMTAGGLVSGVLVYTFAPEAEGHGTDAAIDAFHNKRGKVSGRVPIVKTIASAVTLGTGGSGGREGPIAQIGAGFGSWLGSRLRLSARDRRIMLAAGNGSRSRGDLPRASCRCFVRGRDSFIKTETWNPTSLSPRRLHRSLGIRSTRSVCPLRCGICPCSGNRPPNSRPAGSVFELIPAGAALGNSSSWSGSSTSPPSTARTKPSISSPSPSMFVPRLVPVSPGWPRWPSTSVSSAIRKCSPPCQPGTERFRRR